MKKILFKPYQFAIVLLCMLFFYSCQKDMKEPGGPNGGSVSKNTSVSKELKDFVQVNLVSDDASYDAANLDANLKNGWGLAISSSGQIRVNSEAVGVSGVYTLDGNIVSIPTYIPGSATSDNGVSRPTGHVYNATSDFKLPNGNPALFISASGDGSIAGWNSGNTAVRMADYAPNASYAGITIAADAGNNYLYATNFAENKIDVYDKDWKPLSKTFNDPTVPAGYSPFNIQTIDGLLYVTYAKKNANGDEETGNGKGHISVFNPDGTFVKQFASGGKLNAPWGITKAPTGFWGSSSQLSNMVLVGNFGNGQISVFDANGNFMGVLQSKGKPIEIDGLWGIAFPPSTSLNNTYLYFAAGPGTEQHGLLGYIKNLYLN
jgi:uncharacterized protein (TIGR03118 family)